MSKAKKTFLLVIVVAMLVGCAKPTTPQDPYEKLNRKIFAFNMVFDKVVMRPVAKTYEVLVPPQLRKGVGNAYANVGEVSTIANDLLQGKIGQGIADFWRFVINTTVGVGGLFDVATHLGLKKNYEDFGLTLAHWGIKDSPYLVLPIMGPSTARDAVALPATYYLSPYAYVNDRKLSWAVLGGNYVSKRAELLPTDNLLDQAFDQYIFVRNAYLQRRAYLLKHKYPNGDEDDHYLLDAGS